MSEITETDIANVAMLSRLSFTPEESARFAGQLSNILRYVERLDELDLSGVEPTSHPLPLVNVFREDVPSPSLSPAEALANAPETEAQCFKVPPIIQESG
jgi:aspartyl-tRNA(Asn)/glutamyl-tRNA(Gln) amidotransferase subunit C